MRKAGWGVKVSNRMSCWYFPNYCTEKVRERNSPTTKSPKLKSRTTKSLKLLRVLGTRSQFENCNLRSNQQNAGENNKEAYLQIAIYCLIMKMSTKNSDAILQPVRGYTKRELPLDAKEYLREQNNMKCTFFLMV